MHALIIILFGELGRNLALRHFCLVWGAGRLRRLVVFGRRCRLSSSFVVVVVAFVLVVALVVVDVVEIALVI